MDDHPLYELITKSKDPQKAFEIALKVILALSTQPESSQAPLVDFQPEYAQIIQ